MNSKKKRGGGVWSSIPDFMICTRLYMLISDLTSLYKYFTYVPCPVFLLVTIFLSYCCHLCSLFHFHFFPSLIFILFIFASSLYFHTLCAYSVFFISLSLSLYPSLWGSLASLLLFTPLLSFFSPLLSLSLSLSLSNPNLGNILVRSKLNLVVSKTSCLSMCQHNLP